MRVLCPLAWLLGRRILLAGLDDPTHQTQPDDDQSARDNPALRHSETRCGIGQAGNDQERANEVTIMFVMSFPRGRSGKSAASEAQNEQDEVALFRPLSLRF
jgi:hypothetical protein